MGFVRELSVGEIDGFLQENAVLEKKKKSSILPSKLIRAKKFTSEISLSRVTQKLEIKSFGVN